MTPSRPRPASPNARLRHRLATRARSETGALSAEFAILMCVGAGLAFALYKASTGGGGLVGKLVSIVLSAIGTLMGGFA